MIKNNIPDSTGSEPMVMTNELDGNPNGVNLLDFVIVGNLDRMSQ